TVHHDLREKQPWLDINHFLPRYREAAVVHCLNTTQQSILAEHGIRHTRVIPHGIDRRVLPVPTWPRTLTGDRLRLGLFSRRYSHGVKGEALFEGLLDHLDPARVSFLLVGEERWRDAALARSKGYRVEAFERPPYSLMAEFIRSIDALLILSQHEGGPASLPEALGSGVPVLCTPVGMCPDFVRDGENGLMLSGDVAANSQQIMSLVERAGAGYRRLAEGAFSDAPAIQDWPTVMAGWVALYRQASTSGVPSPV
ncbi:MAG TPA: glycosyltransferase, partial [Bryobacteraceae bacterium]|nr:glycosyltransferase [Bryobacteraceae bacterium]